MLIGGWQASTIFRYSSGLPMYFRSGFCNVPGAFRAGCIPAIINADAVFAQDKGSFDPSKGPLFNKDAFEPVSAFNFYYGRGNRIEEIGPRLRLSQPGPLVHQEHPHGRRHERPDPLRDLQPVELAHVQQCRRSLAASAFNNNLASPDFGKWNGSVTEPRTMQVAARFEF